METNTENKFFLPAAVVIAGLLIAGAVMWNGERPAGTAGTGAEAKVDIKNIKMDDAPFIGSKDAPVTMAVWSDFRCSYCKKFDLTTLPQIVTEYVDAGKVKIVFMDFAFLGPNSTTAALYGHSIWKLYPATYATWRSVVFGAQNEAGDPSFGDASSMNKILASLPGVDVATVVADIKTNENSYKDAMDAQRAEGQKIGINATPSFVIGTQVIQGAYPYENFKTAIDEALK